MLRILSAILACLLLVACASRNRIAKLPPGLSEEEARAQVGREERRVESAGYVLHLHPASNPATWLFLKFVDGRLERKGTFGRWILEPEREAGLKRPLTVEEYYAFSAKLLELGLPEEGYALMRRYQAAHPGTDFAATFLALLYAKGNQPDSAFAIHRAAVAAAKDAKQRSAHQNNLLACYIQTRRYDEGETYAQELLGDSTLEPDFRHSLHYNLACIYSIQNRKAKAVAELAKAVDLKPDAFDQAFLDTDDDFDNIRTEPGFLELRARLKAGKRKGG